MHVRVQVLFAEDATRAFLQAHGLRYLVRSHQVLITATDRYKAVKSGTFPQLVNDLRKHVGRTVLWGRIPSAA